MTLFISAILDRCLRTFQSVPNQLIHTIEITCVPFRSEPPCYLQPLNLTSPLNQLSSFCLLSYPDFVDLSGQQSLIACLILQLTFGAGVYAGIYACQNYNVSNAAWHSGRSILIKPPARRGRKPAHFSSYLKIEAFSVIIYN